MHVWVPLSLLLAAAPPAASAPAAQPNPFLAAAKQLYVALEYEKALDQLSRARSVPGCPATDLVAIEIYTGLVKFELNDIEGARSAFRTGLALDSSAQIPPDLSPKLQREWQSIEHEMVKTRKTADLEAAQIQEPQAPPPTPTPAPSLAAPVETPAAGGLASTAPSSPPEHSGLTYVLLGGGGAALVAGAILAGLSASSHNSALSAAAAGQPATSLGNTSATEGRVGLGLAVVGAAAAVVGAVSWFSSPEPTPTRQ